MKVKLVKTPPVRSEVRAQTDLVLRVEFRIQNTAEAAAEDVLRDFMHHLVNAKRPGGTTVSQFSATEFHVRDAVIVPPENQ